MTNEEFMRLFITDLTRNTSLEFDTISLKLLKTVKHVLVIPVVIIINQIINKYLTFSR